jgi:hypothetical protein
MANASKKHIGPGAQGKNDGSGAMASEEAVKDMIGENDILSNRDKSRHSDERGLDSKTVQNEQMQDHVGNHIDDAVTESDGGV